MSFYNRIIIGVFAVSYGMSAWADHHMNSMASDRISDITNTRHNFSTQAPLSGATAVNEGRVCVFCHTPHHSLKDSIATAPLWNRQASTAAYTEYRSSSTDATIGIEPGDKSKMCLSCHDGTLAIGSIGVSVGSTDTQGNVTFNTQNIDIPMQNTGPNGTIPEGEGVNTGFTKNLGVDLRNDHPIAFVYDGALAGADGELKNPANSPYIANREARTLPAIPLFADKVECVSCHDPHVRSTNPNENIKFLRLHRFQDQFPSTAEFDVKKDIGCVACHEKAGWTHSSHANPAVGDEHYTPEAAKLRDFIENISDPNMDTLPVWRVSCLNCHDAHTVPGAKLLLREGTDDQQLPNVPKQGGEAAQEETCYGCHSSDGAVLKNQGPGSAVKDIKQDFLEPYRMPITSTDQAAGTEVHDVGAFTAGALEPQDPQWGKDLIESRTQLGLVDDNKRHVECSDCHNPHRMSKNYVATTAANVPDPQGTHRHDETVMHTNIASGSLRGTWGVEPIFGANQEAFLSLPIDFDVKRGDTNDSAITAVNSTYVTREYQVCLKCHSTYSYSQPPPLGLSGGTTAIGFPAGMSNYTDQAMEFQAPTLHKGEGTANNSGANLTINNHRSWHPVMGSTGRTPAITGLSPDTFTGAFKVGIGEQTMYCSDCHGSVTDLGTAVPKVDRSWGPHGSSEPFVLKGSWNANTGTGQQDGLCFKCHRYDDYANSATNNTPNTSGFRTATPVASTCAGETNVNLHTGHARCIPTGLRCVNCHVAVPHGWKNKALLVNLNDVGAEVTGAPVVNVNGETNPPYYADAKLRISQFDLSGQWQKNSCAGSNCHTP